MILHEMLHKEHPNQWDDFPYVVRLNLPVDDRKEVYYAAILTDPKDISFYLPVKFKKMAWKIAYVIAYGKKFNPHYAVYIIGADDSVLKWNMNTTKARYADTSAGEIVKISDATILYDNCNVTEQLCKTNKRIFVRNCIDFRWMDDVAHYNLKNFELDSSCVFNWPFEIKNQDQIMEFIDLITRTPPAMIRRTGAVDTQMTELIPYPLDLYHYVSQKQK